MIFPDRLNLGDTIGIVAPSSPVTKECALQCKNYLETMGYTVLMGESTMQSLHGYLAGDDLLRANDINQMFSNPAVKAIFCIRGGYGGNRLMKLLDYDLIRKNPKIFVGYSDITSFHLAFHSLCNMVTFHGPMVSSNMLKDFDDYTNHSLFEAINLDSPLKLCNPEGCKMEVITNGCACGQIIGGCLSLVSPAIGTFYQPDFHNKILFLEDVDETLPRCDKMMEHLFNAGIMDQISGLILGDFIDCSNKTDPTYTIIDYFKDRFATFPKPVMYNIKSGHGKPMATIPFGTLCRMNTLTRCITFEVPEEYI